MKLRDVTIKIQSLDDYMDDFVETYEKVRKREKVEPEEILSFVNVDVMRQILTKQRLRLLRLVREKKPKTIYELAKIAQRPYVNVFQDVKKLKEMGLLELEEKRHASTPKAKYGRLKIEVPI